MKEIIITVLTAVLGGGIGAALIASYSERWRLKFQRKAQKEDQAAEKADTTKELAQELNKMQQEEEKRNRDLHERFAVIDKQIAAQSEGVKIILLDRIIQYGEYLVGRGEVTYDERRRFHIMHDCYHDSLNGNGNADLIKEAVDKLPLKATRSDGDGTV